MQNFGVNSMVAPLKRVMVVSPKPFPGNVTWQEFNYFHAPDEAKTVAEHAAFRQILKAEGCEVVTVDQYDSSLQDALFTHDPSLMTPFGAIVARMGKTLRLGENALHTETYKNLEIPILGQIQAPGTLEVG
jgi:dimethylargininase